MTQFRSGTCIKEFLARPNMMDIPYSGYVSRNEPKVQLCGPEKSRRDDGIIPSFGNGTPKVPSHKTDVRGIAYKSEQIAYQSVNTNEGVIQIPTSQHEQQFMHSVKGLNFLTQQYSDLDTRLQPYPTRYFS